MQNARSIGACKGKWSCRPKIPVIALSLGKQARFSEVGVGVFGPRVDAGVL